MREYRHKNIELIQCQSVGGSELSKLKEVVEVLAAFKLIDYGIVLKIPFLVDLSNFKKSREVKVNVQNTSSIMHFPYQNIEPIPDTILFKESNSHVPFVSLVMDCMEDLYRSKRDEE